MPKLEITVNFFPLPMAIFYNIWHFFAISTFVKVEKDHSSAVPAEEFQKHHLQPATHESSALEF